MRLRSRLVLGALLAAATALAAACGDITTPAPASSATSAPASASAALPTGSQYAKYYKPNGTATLQAGKVQTITLTNFSFSPNTLTVAAGTPVKLKLVNVRKNTPHNFTLDAWNVSVNVSPGQTATASFTPDTPGTYYFYCNVPGHAELGMVGKLTVTAASAAASSSSASSSSSSAAATAAASSSGAAAPVSAPPQASSSTAASSSSTPASSAGSSTPASSASSSAPPASSPAPSLPTASQYAQYYKPDGSATLQAGQTLTMIMTDFKFTPNTLSVAEGTPVSIHLENQGAAPHTFTLPAWNVNVTVNPGGSTTVHFTPSATGTYYWYCAEPGHAELGMVGQITVH